MVRANICRRHALLLLVVLPISMGAATISVTQVKEERVSREATASEENTANSSPRCDVTLKISGDGITGEARLKSLKIDEARDDAGRSATGRCHARAGG